MLFLTLDINVEGYILKRLIRLFSAVITLLIKAAFLIDNLNKRLNPLIDSLLLRMSSIVRIQPVA